MAGLAVKVTIPSMRDDLAREERRQASAITAGMRESTDELKGDLRGQVLSAGLGQRLANTWRGQSFPKGRNSLHPAGYVWSNAPDIIDFFAGDHEVVPLNGKKFLAIPTAIARREQRGRYGARPTVASVIARKGQKMTVVKGRNGTRIGLFDESVSVRTGKRRKGQKRNLVAYFIFVPSVRGRKRFDIPAAVDKVVAGIPDRIVAHLQD